MTHIECPALDGSNPLDFLASLGLFRLACGLWPTSKMCWQIKNGAWRPEYDVDADAEDFAERVAGMLVSESRTSSISSGPSSGPKSKDIKCAEDAWKRILGNARDEAKKQGLQKREMNAFVEAQDAVREAKLRLALLRSEKAQFLEKKSESLGYGVAHYGDIISVPLNVARKHALRSVEGALRQGVESRDAFIAEQLSALGTEVVRSDGAIQPCAFSFSNGQGGQLLLKNFRDCAQLVSGPLLNRWISGEKVESRDATSLNWDPADRNDYALRWSDPGKSSNSSGVDYIRNALGFLGLGMLTCVPISSEQIASVCWDEGFYWGVWDCAIGLDTCRCLLGQIGPKAVSDLKRRGTEDVYYSERLRVGAPPATRFYFSPSRSL